MKCFAAILLLAFVAVALADKEPEKIEAPKAAEPIPAQIEAENAARDKRGALFAAYSAPVAYTAYVPPVAYSSYSYPYAYAYRSYPYYYSNSYYVA